MSVQVGVLIALNFLVTVFEAQVGIHGHYRSTFVLIEWIFFGIFWVELLVNVGTTRDFVRDPWNLFDTIVVAASTVQHILSDTRHLHFLRLVRAFRVFRLLKRVNAVHFLVTAILSAIPGMLHAMVLLFLSLAIFALVATENFGRAPCSFTVDGQHGGPQTCSDLIVTTEDNFTTYSRACGRHNPPGVSMITECRAGPEFGHVYFGNFFKALWSLLQILLGDTWSEAIARPLLEQSPATAIFFIGFILINTFILFNVVIAVLLDEMVLHDNHHHHLEGAPPPKDATDPMFHPDPDPSNWNPYYVFQEDGIPIDDEKEASSSGKSKKVDLAILVGPHLRRMNARLTDMEAKIAHLRSMYVRHHLSPTK